VGFAAKQDRQKKAAPDYTDSIDQARKNVTVATLPDDAVHLCRRGDPVLAAIAQNARPAVRYTRRRSSGAKQHLKGRTSPIAVAEALNAQSFAVPNLAFSDQHLVAGYACRLRQPGASRPVEDRP